jgi:hypothetical protein
VPKCAVLEALLDGEQTWYTAGRTTNCFLLCVLHHLCTWEVHCISFHSAPRGTLVRCVLTSTLARSGQISGNTRTICDYDKLCFTGLHSDDDVVDLILNRLSNTFAEAELTRDNRGSLPLHISICSKADLCYPGIDCSQSAIGCFLLSQKFFLFHRRPIENGILLQLQFEYSLPLFRVRPCGMLPAAAASSETGLDVS